MAFILLKSGEYRFIPASKGREIWFVMNGEKHPTDAQRQFIKKIDRIHLNRYNAPKSYLDKFGERLHDSVSVEPQQIRLPYKD